MKRDFGQLAGGPFDLLVVGGGIYGAWTAYDAALSGLRVALVEQNDWAGATSSASSKMIHGGLRYLEHGRLGLVRKTLVERRRLARLAPHRVRPLRLLFPLYTGDRVGRTRMRLGMWFYDRLAGGDQPVPAHRWLGASELTDLIAIDPERLRGGFAFGDCRTDDARLTLEIVDGAGQAGAVVVNRAAASRLVVENERVVGAMIEDLEEGTTLELRADVTVCCGGAWIGSLCAGFGLQPTATRLTKGVHLVLPGLGGNDALVISSNDDGRIVFLIPWYGRTLLGTTDTDYSGDPGDLRVEPDDVAYLLERAGRALRHPRWTASDVIAGFAGLRTLPATDDPNPSDVTREWSLTEPVAGLFVSVGGKLTSARSDAATAVDRVCRHLERSRRDSPTADRAFPWSPTEPYDDWLTTTVGAATTLGLDEETARTCAERYGSRIDAVLEQVREEPGLARRIVADLPFCRAEIVHAAREEMVVSLEDLLRRRIPLVLLTRLDEKTVQEIAEIAGRHLGWSERDRRREVQELLERYPTSVVTG